MNTKILIKISGEMLGSENESFNKKNIDNIVQVIKQLKSNHSQIYLVVGGGNIARGRELSNFEFSNGDADRIGMLSTLQNALFLKHSFSKVGIPAHVMGVSDISWLQVHAYEPGKAKWWVENNHIVIFGGGLGICGFSTDMTCVSRAYEAGVDTIIKVTAVGGLFDSDPKKNPNAKLITNISFDEVLEKKYGVMDESAFLFAKEKKMKIRITSLENLLSDDAGSIIS